MIYPPTCGICGKFDSKFLCKKCEKILEKESNFQIDKYNEKIFHYKEHLYFFKYGGIIRKIMLEYKFGEESYLYKTLVKFLTKNKKFFEILKKYDKIIPVPINRKRKKERGYNQSLLIAKELSFTTGIKCEEKCLYKIKNIAQQSKLNKQERIENIKGVYKLKNKKVIEKQKILLIDDIYTTGSTVKECCKILKQAEPESIGVLTIAKD